MVGWPGGGGGRGGSEASTAGRAMEEAGWARSGRGRDGHGGSGGAGRGRRLLRHLRLGRRWGRQCEEDGSRKKMNSHLQILIQWPKSSGVEKEKKIPGCDIDNP